jgi:hypothetical protein
VCPYVFVSTNPCRACRLINFIIYLIAPIYSGSCKSHIIHMWLTSPPFGRYSNTLLVSLNNRNSIRDTYYTLGAAVDCQVELHPRNSAHPSATTDGIILEPDKPQTDRMDQPVAEEEVEERVNSKSCGHHVTVSISYASNSSRDYYAPREPT